MSKVPTRCSESLASQSEHRILTDEPRGRATDSDSQSWGGLGVPTLRLRLPAPSAPQRPPPINSSAPPKQRAQDGAGRRRRSGRSTAVYGRPNRVGITCHGNSMAGSAARPDWTCDRLMSPIRAVPCSFVRCIQREREREMQRETKRDKEREKVWVWFASAGCLPDAIPCALRAHLPNGRLSRWARPITAPRVKGEYMRSSQTTTSV